MRLPALFYLAALVILIWQPLKVESTSLTLTEVKSNNLTISAVSTPKEEEKRETKKFCPVNDKSIPQFEERLLGKATLTSGSQNALLAARLVNGKVLKPGEVFSFNRIVGPRTVYRGFGKGQSVVKTMYGYEVASDIGGGVCQTSTVIYQAAKKTNLKILERHAHSLPVGYAPPGEDAAVAWGSLDLKFKNNKNYPVRVVCCSYKGSLVTKIIGLI